MEQDEPDDRYALLRANGFHYYAGRELFVNRSQKKVVSREAVDDHTIHWLHQILEEHNTSSAWQLYFDDPVSDQLRAEIIAELEPRRSV